MNTKELNHLLENDEELICHLYQNGRFHIGSVHFHPRKFRDALYELLESGEIGLFDKESDKKDFFDKLKTAPPDKDEMEKIRTIFFEENLNYSECEDELINEIALDYYQKANDDILLKRLISKNVKQTLLAIIRNFEKGMSDAFLSVFSTAQMNADSEIRKEIGIPELPSKRRRDFVLLPHKRTLSKLLDTGHGGKRTSKNFVWTDEAKIKFYETVENLPKIKGKSIWEYAYEKLDEEDFDDKYIRYLQTKLKDAPKKLFTEAIATWRKYNNSFNKPKPEEKPFAFALKHALISFKDFKPIKFSTMDKYYRQGKKLSKNSKLKTEDSK